MDYITKKQVLGFVGGILLAAGIIAVDINGLDGNARICLAVSMLAVCWWTTKVMNPGFVSLVLLVLYSLCLDKEVVPGTVIFGAFTSPVMYLVIGGFLIAEAVQISGLGERLALIYTKKYIRNYRGIIISCYLLGALLSFIIPHPWPRSFLILSVMGCVVGAAEMEEKYANNIRLAIFLGSIPTSMILLTGDSTLNPVVADFAGETVSWLQWVLFMGLPGIFASILLCLLQLRLFGQPDSFRLDQSKAEHRLQELGKRNKKEKICIAVLVVAVMGWMSDSISGIHPAWIAMVAVIVLALPFCKVLTARSLSSINLETLLFLCAALSIGNVGKVTGMNAWIANTLLPSSCPSNPYLFALITCGICMAIHMLLGSTLAVLGIVVPAIVSFGALAGIPPLAASMIAYIAVASHWLLPFHHMNILVGCSEDTGNLQEKDVITMGICQTLLTAVICIAAITWWKIIGLL